MYSAPKWGTGQKNDPQNDEDLKSPWLDMACKKEGTVYPGEVGSHNLRDITVTETSREIFQKAK